VSAVADALRALDAALRSAGARWYLFGAQAALIHGTSRLTADIDATVAWQDASRVEPLRAAVRAHGFVDRPVATDFTARTRVLPLEHSATRIEVDLVLGGPGLEELFLSRAREHDVEGVRVPVASAEDLIAMKVLGGRPKDLEDVRALLAANSGRLDLAHVRGVLSELESALDRRDLLPALDLAIADASGR
jgi:hypothetical protein